MARRPSKHLTASYLLEMEFDVEEQKFLSSRSDETENDLSSFEFHDREPTQSVHVTVCNSNSPLVYVTTKSRETASARSSFICEQDHERLNKCI